MKNIEDSTTEATAEQRFIRDALASSERAEKFQRIKVVVTILAFGCCDYAFNQPVTAQHTAWQFAQRRFWLRALARIDAAFPPAGGDFKGLC